jgi:hypothetical protein
MFNWTVKDKFLVFQHPRPPGRSGLSNCLQMKKKNEFMLIKILLTIEIDSKLEKKIKLIMVILFTI